MAKDETLGQLQETFAVLAAKLVLHANSLGYKTRLGDVFRDPRSHGAQGVRKAYGEASSAHKNKLAIDINLFQNGEFLTRTEDHQQLGEWWEKQHPLCRWGGRFRAKDGNHYSMEWQGVS
jgi:hypothetical protein